MPTVPRSELVAFGASCLQACGATEQNAAIVSNVLARADARGIPSHGSNRLHLYCDELKRGAVSASSIPIVVQESPGGALVDGANAQGPVVGEFCMTMAIEKAKTAGIALVVCR